MTEQRRMRIRRGRVMHVVKPTGGGFPGYLKSECYTVRRGGRMQGASMPESYWTAERYWYPDCEHCPAATGSSVPTGQLESGTAPKPTGGES